MQCSVTTFEEEMLITDMPNLMTRIKLVRNDKIDQAEPDGVDRIPYAKLLMSYRVTRGSALSASGVVMIFHYNKALGHWETCKHGF